MPVTNIFGSGIAFARPPKRAFLKHFAYLAFANLATTQNAIELKRQVSPRLGLLIHLIDEMEPASTLHGCMVEDEDELLL